jgi:hypothetical protein
VGGDKAGLETWATMIAAKRYTFLSINYELAPQVHYSSPLTQLMLFLLNVFPQTVHRRLLSRLQPRCRACPASGVQPEPDIKGQRPAMSCVSSPSPTPSPVKTST